MDKNVAVVEALLQKAEGAGKSEDAMRFSQAACNAANTLCALSSVRPKKDSPDE